MAAKILVTSGDKSSRLFWIETEVSRIGSAPQADIRIPGVPAQCLTLQYREGKYHVFNRHSSPIRLGGATVASGVSATWKPRVELALPGDIRLLLSVEGRGEPTPAPSRSETAESASVARRAKQRRQVAAIVVCFAIAASITIMGGDAPADDHSEFDRLTQTLLWESRHQNHSISLETPVQLQQARASELRGDYPTALRLYVDVRDQLLSLRAAGSNADSEVVEEALAFVSRRLATVSPQAAMQESW